MERGETELEMVRRHIREGERRIADQCARIAERAASGSPTHEAETLLANFRDAQRQHEEHLGRIDGRQR